MKKRKITNSQIVIHVFFILFSLMFLLPLLRGCFSPSEEKKEEPDELPRVFVSQRVPSVREAIRGKRK